MSTVYETDRLAVVHLDAAPAPLVRGGHVHTCPECYEHVLCDLACHCEPDLTLDDGTARGGFATCDACVLSLAIGGRL